MTKPRRFSDGTVGQYIAQQFGNLTSDKCSKRNETNLSIRTANSEIVRSARDRPAYEETFGVELRSGARSIGECIGLVVDLHQMVV